MARVRPEPTQGRVLMQRVLPLTPHDWQAALQRHLGRTVDVRYGRSRTAPVRVHAATGAPLTIRLHELFAAAPPAVVAALGSWIRAGRRAKRAGALLDAWLAGELQRLPPPVVGPLEPRGDVHDLGGMLSDIIASHVPELLEAPPPVTWGRRRRSPGVRCLHLGTFDPETRVIRIHPVLDHARVPEFFVRFVLFHELLHAAMPAAEGTRRHHPPAFRRRERAHPDHGRAVAWEERALPALLRRARRGTRPTRPGSARARGAG